MSLDRPAPAPGAAAAGGASATGRRLVVGITGPAGVVCALDARSR